MKSLSYRLPKEIKSEKDVYDFFYYIIGKEETIFHPDDSFHGYINLDTHERSFDEKTANNYDRLRLQCFEVCNRVSRDRIYEIGMEVDSEFR